MTVVQADGNDVAPVAVDQFRISVAETYDVIVEPKADRAFTLFVQPEDRSGFARGTLAPRAGMTAPIPPMDPRPMRTMADMGMGDMAMGGVDSGENGMAGMDHGSMPGMKMDHGAMAGANADAAAGKLEGRVGVDNVAMMPTQRLDHAGEGIPAGRRVLTYKDLRATRPGLDRRPPSREIDAPPDRQHGALHLGLQRQEILRGRAGPM